MFKSLKRLVYKATNLAEAKEWYSKVLGTQPIFDSPFTVIFNINGCTLSFTKTDLTLTDIPETSETYWEVDDIDETFRELLKNNGKVHTPIKDIMNTRIAKVIDPFGNIIGLTGNQTGLQERTVEKKPSETALRVAFCRALASKDEREEIKGGDYLAELFLTDKEKKAFVDGIARKWTVKNIITSPLYGYLLSRTAYIDEIFKKQLSQNIPQIVLLGAGYDTRALRYEELLDDTRIFELDISSTQNNKKEILEKSDIDIPKQVSFVSINFKQDNLLDVLLNAGYNEKVKTLFIWEGVTYYLQAEQISKTLEFVHNHSSNESLICFDYLTDQKESLNPAEPFLFWTDSDGMERMLSENGFLLIENLNAKDIEKNYLTLKDGSSAEKTLPFFCLATAKTVDY